MELYTAIDTGIIILHHHPHLQLVDGIPPLVDGIPPLVDGIPPFAPSITNLSTSSSVAATSSKSRSCFWLITPFKACGSATLLLIKLSRGTRHWDSYGAVDDPVFILAFLLSKIFFILDLYPLRRSYQK